MFDNISASGDIKHMQEKLYDFYRLFCNGNKIILNLDLLKYSGYVNLFTVTQ